ncbi:MAG: polyphosphate polymerase domain-containing protein [Lachnospiraceae bacterium]|nr:polyphosphate polymerase domain-containing protein [Lachnospiraceae bacterium]
MAYQAVFQRYELKYMITREQKETILHAMQPYMALDDYGRTTIRNIYYDTDTYRLIRHSIEKPVYKEKLRLRSYGQACADSKIFVELKKKYKSVVYKRRLSMTEDSAMQWLDGRSACGEPSQISGEIEYFISYYKTLKPRTFLSYEREAYFSLDRSDFRVTFDDHILSRQEEVSLQSQVWGEPLLEEGKVLMEIKCSEGIPLWMTSVLSKERIFKSSFSKYGTAYQEIIYPQLKREKFYDRCMV